MSTVRRIAKNTIVLLVAQALSYILAFLYMIYVARYLSPSNFGILSFAIAFTTLVSVLGDLGLQWFLTCDLARDIGLTKRYLANIIPLKIILALLAYGIIIIITFALGLQRETALVVAILAVSVVLNVFMYAFQAVYQAYEEMEYIGYSLLLNASVIFIGVLFAIYFKADLIGIAAIYALASTITLIFNVIILRLRFRDLIIKPSTYSLRIEPSFIKYTIKESWPVAIAVVFNGIYSWTDTVILNAMQNSTAVGYYSSAFKLIQTLSVIPIVLSTAIFPVMSRFHIGSTGSFKMTFEKALKYLFMLSLPIAIGTTLLSERLISLFYGAAFLPATLPLQILIWSIPLFFSNIMFASYFNVSGRQIVYMTGCIIVACVNVVLNVIFIPQYGIQAASTVRVITEIPVLAFYIVQIYLTGYNIIKGATFKILGKIVLASLIMGVFIFYFLSVNLAVLIVASVVLYFALIFAFRTLDNTDIGMAKQIYSFRKYDEGAK